MTDKEKAKAYDEALEKARKALSEISLENYGARKIIEDAFPVLRESEDERIRMVLCDIVRDMPYMKTELRAHGLSVEKTLAYLEKQKEQNKCPEFCSGHCVGCERNEQKEQKSAEWSEEDEAMIKSILFVLESYVSKAECEQNPALTATYPTYYKEIDWLKSLPERLNLQPEQEWGEEDEKTIDDAYCWLCEYAGSLIQKNYGKSSMLYGIANKLKSLRPQIKDCADCSKHLEGYISGRGDAENKLLEMFGILLMPDGELRMKPRWKPSGEQMKALLNIEGDLRAFQYNDKAKIIAELYEQLKSIQ